MSGKRVKVTVYEKVTYKFRDATSRCSAHGQALCINCARTGPRPCQCEMHDATGMHWDTCPGRAR